MSAPGMRRPKGRPPGRRPFTASDYVRRSGPPPPDLAPTLEALRRRCDERAFPVHLEDDDTHLDGTPRGI